MKEIGKYCISDGVLKFNFNTTTGWVFPLDNDGKIDFNTFGVDLRWRMSVMCQDINNRHKTVFTVRQVQNMVNNIVSDSGSICVDDSGNFVLSWTN